MEETILKIAHEILRPFSVSARVKNRSYSYHLQKAIVDLGADVSFQEAKKKVLEHYQIEVPLSAVQSIVENHAKNIFEFTEKETFEEGTAQQIIGEMDGSMVPVVDTAIPAQGKPDSRKCRTTRWQEARLCFARGAKQVTPIFYATMGTVERAGDMLYRAALRVGFGPRTQVHGLGDGALWIESQMQRIFGRQVKYLVDFYHTSEYLAKAAEHSWASEKEKWRKEQQERLKESRYKEVLKIIRRRLPEEWEEKKGKRQEEPGTPVERCYRYIAKRKESLDYKRALENELPIGSGEIESAHRYVIQKRLKIAGAWWRPITAEHMLALRTLRANGDWNRYWGSCLKAA